ncbi:heat shock 70 kDa protein 12B-like [Mytilus galloprovincialis]|uniref:heat shock 70 kDa protein 12B-like n=1 Tax=Mytilus galloprovincialis TaxID=29158 RepID=UPI003F7C3294
MEKSNYMMVAALDFGTTYSGYAFSFRNDFETEPLKIQANPIWMTGSSQFMSLKTPTCLLLDKDQKFVAFGFQAENMYAEYVLDELQDEFYYFHRFKMYLHNNKNITSTMVLEDITGKTLPAFDVFKLSIKALVNHLLETLDTQGTGVKHDEVQWVLTVPAIWTDTAKQFMRSSAEEAGINPDKLILSLEPEAASILCQYLPITKSEKGFEMSKIGTEYMVVDLGGGTADITVHQKVEKDQLKEKHRATGNNCGGTSVDNRFFILLENIFGKSLMESLKKENPLAYLDLERSFEAAKRNIDPNNKGKVTMTIPFTTLDKLCKKINKTDFETLVEASDYANEIKLLNDKIRFNIDLIVNLFKPSIDSVILLMKEVLRSKSTKGVTHFLMVGGFSECSLLQNEIRKSFPGKQIIVPKDAGLSVLKGAVLFGHRPDYIKSRIMPRTYGVMTSLPFDPRKFDEKYCVVMDGEERCDKIFSLITSVDDSVEAGTKFEKSYFTPFPNQEKMDFNVYVSTEANPCYVDEEGCKHLCTPTIIFPDICPDKRWVDVEFELGNTEIKMTAKDRKSGKQIKAQINLLHP